MRSAHLLFARQALLAGVCVLGGCAAGPDFQRPTAPEGASLLAPGAAQDTVRADGQAQRFSSDASLPADWWQLFGSETLDRMVERALAHNPGVQAAEASLRQSEANLRAGQGVFWPQLGINAAATRERGSPALQGQATSGAVFKVMTLSGTVSYTLDAFGHDRRVVEGLSAQAEFQAQQRRAAYLSLSSTVVNAALARAAYGEQLALLEDLLSLQQTQLRWIEAQVRAGIGAYASLLQQRSLLDATQAQLAPLRQRLAQTEHLLAALQGLSPGEARLPALRLSDLHLPRDLPLSLPSTLVRQRPDILAAEAQLHAATAAVGVATADLYPHISLTASYGAASNSFSQLSQPNGRFWSVGPSLSLPLFQGGSLTAQREAAEQGLLQSEALYRQTVLTAFAQVADAMQALRHDAELLMAQGDARYSAEDALRLAQAGERAGLLSGPDLLAAQILQRQAHIDYLQALAQRHQDTVALFAALGGGWWSAQGAAR